MLTAVVVLFSVLSSLVVATPAVNECEGMRIALLDANDLARLAGARTCSLKEVHVSIDNGIVYSKNLSIEGSAAHNFGTHSAPWFLESAIKTSPYFTTDLDSADIIFINDYCHYIVWLGHLHAYGNEQQHGPGDDLVAIYQEIMKLPSWRKSEGAHFAIYDSHPGFYQGKAAIKASYMRCSTFRNLIHMIVDTPMRNVCEAFWSIKKILVTPYVPNPLDVNNPRAYMQQPYRPLSQRPTMAYCRSRCDAEDVSSSTNAGKLMRHYFSHVLWGNNTAMNVRCTDREISKEGHLPFSTMFEAMRSSRFCPVFPGDAASTRRLSEIFLAGCIPVFLGPPYHSMPFSDTVRSSYNNAAHPLSREKKNTKKNKVPYKDVGIFLNITDTSHWLKNEAGPTKMEWKLDSLVRAVHETEARWWVPDVDLSDVLINVASPEDVLEQLLKITPEVMEAKLKLMHRVGHQFSFLRRLTEPPNAVNALLTGMCKKQKQFMPIQVATV